MQTVREKTQKGCFSFDDLVKSLKRPISVIPANPGSGPGQAPESSYFKPLKILWTPVFGELSRAVSAGVTTFYENIILASFQSSIIPVFQFSIIPSFPFPLRPERVPQARCALNPARNCGAENFFFTPDLDSLPCPGDSGIDQLPRQYGCVCVWQKQKHPVKF